VSRCQRSQLAREIHARALIEQAIRARTGSGSVREVPGQEGFGDVARLGGDLTEGVAITLQQLSRNSGLWASPRTVDTLIMTRLPGLGFEEWVPG
jgi:hypothetical protein